MNGTFFWPTVLAGLYIPSFFWARPIKKRARLLPTTFLGASRQETGTFSTLASEVASFEIHAPFIWHLFGRVIEDTRTSRLFPTDTKVQMLGVAVVAA